MWLDSRTGAPYKAIEVIYEAHRTLIGNRNLCFRHSRQFRYASHLKSQAASNRFSNPLVSSAKTASVKAGRSKVSRAFRLLR